MMIGKKCSSGIQLSRSKEVSHSYKNKKQFVLFFIYLFKCKYLKNSNIEMKIQKVSLVSWRKIFWDYAKVSKNIINAQIVVCQNLLKIEN